MVSCSPPPALLLLAVSPCTTTSPTASPPITASRGGCWGQEEEEEEKHGSWSRRSGGVRWYERPPLLVRVQLVGDDKKDETASIKVRGGLAHKRGQGGRQARPASSYVSSGGRLRWSCGGEDEGEGRGEQSGASCSSTKARSSSYRGHHQHHLS